MIFNLGKYYSEKNFNINLFNNTNNINESLVTIGFNSNMPFIYNEIEGYSEFKIKNKLQEFADNLFYDKVKHLKLLFFYNLNFIKEYTDELFYFSDGNLIAFYNNDTIYYSYIDVLNYITENYLIELKNILKNKNIILFDDYKLLYYANFGYYDFNSFIKQFNYDLKYLSYIFYTNYNSLKKVDYKPLKRAKYVEDKLSNTIINIKDIGLIKLKYEGLSKTTGRIFCKDDKIYIQGLNKKEKKEKILSILKNDSIYEFDFKSFEYKILYTILGLELNEDPHLKTSEIIFKDKTKREEAKQINFRILYGGSFNNIELDNEALNYLEENLLKPRNLINDKLLIEYKEFGYIKNYFGRIIKPKKENALLSNYISSTASDILIYKMVLLYKFLKNKKSKIVTQIFDSIIFNINSIEEKEIINDIKNILESNYKIFNFKVDIEKYGNKNI